MIIAIDTSPLESGHSVRGVGFYLKHLIDSLEKNFPNNSYISFKGELPQGNFDVVHYPYFDPFFVNLPFNHRIPIVVTVHDLIPILFPQHFPSGLKGRLKWEANKYLLRKVETVITDSNSSTQDVKKLIGMPDDRIKTVYLAAGEEFKEIKTDSQNLRKKYNLPDEFLLYVGDITWNKNLPLLSKAVIQTSIPIVMVGKAISETDYDKSNVWNKDRQNFNKIVANSSLFNLLGFIPTEDLIALYNSATALVMPSLYEGFGLPIIEAMQCGCPVITSKEGSIPEVGSDAVYYVEAYSQESIANGIKKVFFSKKLQDELSQKGKRQAMSFSWKKTAEQTVEVYKHIAKNNE